MERKITCLCPTYRRPVQLANAIACFESQTYSNKELIILDDSGQYPNMEGDGWKIVSSQVRWRTLGEKRNATAALTSQDTEIYAVWDDDDAYLPWHLQGVADALQDADYCIPSALWHESFEKGVHHLRPQANKTHYHGAWGFTRDIFQQAGGYPFEQSGQDQSFLRRVEKVGPRFQDSYLWNGQARRAPSYIYRWCTIPGHYHISGLNKHNGYEEVMPQIPFQKLPDMGPEFEHDWLRLVKNASSHKTLRDARNRDELG